MKQECHISMIYLSWAVYLGGIAASAATSRWGLCAAWIVAAPLAQWLYIRRFPRISAAMGYGPIADESAPPVAPAADTVTLYTALGCPFCPILEKRLEDLQEEMRFTLRTVDVTLRPGLLASKGIRSVPVVEVRGQFLFGLVSSNDLACAIARPAVAVR